MFEVINLDNEVVYRRYQIDYLYLVEKIKISKKGDEISNLF